MKPGDTGLNPAGTFIEFEKQPNPKTTFFDYLQGPHEERFKSKNLPEY